MLAQATLVPQQKLMKSLLRKNLQPSLSQKSCHRSGKHPFDVCVRFLA